MNLDTLFLDRDGVINTKLESKYIESFSQFEFIHNSLNAIKILSAVFKRIIVVTNQQGIGKGTMSETDLNKLHQNMIIEINLNGGKIDKIYYCPHLVSDNCQCRKPKTGMLSEALKDFPDIKIENSYLVGDSITDIKAGEVFGLKTIQVNSQFTLYSWAKRLLKI
ncbi:MAG: HAD family hydrolase [Bacteroidota bacterium]|nr:HAD family hydrolase [Bacteroidota bacterium]